VGAPALLGWIGALAPRVRGAKGTGGARLRSREDALASTKGLRGEFRPSGNFDASCAPDCGSSKFSGEDVMESGGLDSARSDDVNSWLSRKIPAACVSSTYSGTRSVNAWLWATGGKIFLSWLFVTSGVPGC